MDKYASKPSAKIEEFYNLEFDAPQWLDFEKEKEREISGDLWSPNRDFSDTWFEEVHPLHEPRKNPNKKIKLTASKSVIDQKGKKLSLNVSKPGVPRTVDSLPADNLPDYNLTFKENCPVHTERKSSSEDGETVVKKPRRCWKLDECNTFSFSPCSTIPEHMLPKRASSLTHNAQCEAILGRSSNDKSAEISPAIPISSQKTEKENAKASITKEFHEVINNNQRVMDKQPQWDENGRRIKKGNPETCPAPTEMETEIKSSKTTIKNKRRSADSVRDFATDTPKQDRLKETRKRRSCFPLSTVKETSSKHSHKNPTTSRSTSSKVSHGHKSKDTEKEVKSKGNFTRQTSFRAALTISQPTLSKTVPMAKSEETKNEVVSKGKITRQTSFKTSVPTTSQSTQSKGSYAEKSEKVKLNTDTKSKGNVITKQTSFRDTASKPTTLLKTSHTEKSEKVATKSKGKFTRQTSFNRTTTKTNISFAP